MEYLFQFQIVAKDLLCDDLIVFNYKGMEIRLYLNNKSWISPGKKAHFILKARTWKEALEIIQNCRSDLTHRLMFLTNEPIIIYTQIPEFVIWDQLGSKVREIHFWDIDLSTEHHLDTTYIECADDFFKLKIEESDFLAMEFYNEALQSNLPTEQYRTLFMALEKLIKTNTVTEKCDKCGATLNPRAKNKQIDDFLTQQDNDIDIFGANNYPKASELRRLRGKLSHPPNKRGIVNSEDLDETIRVLSRVIRCHLENKFQVGYTAYAISKPLNTFSYFQAIFHTEHSEDKFALDVPPIEEFNNRSSNTRWIFE